MEDTPLYPCFSGRIDGMTLHSIPRRDSLEPGAVPDFTLGDRLRKALDHAGISVATMADVQGVGTATVSRWMHDRSPVKRGALMLWAIATGVDQQWLETGTAGLENQTGRDQYAIRDSNPEPAD